MSARDRAKDHIARIRAAQAEPVPDDAEPYFTMCHGQWERLGPDGQAAMGELMRAVIAAVKARTIGCQK